MRAALRAASAAYRARPPTPPGAFCASDSEQQKALPGLRARLRRPGSAGQRRRRGAALDLGPAAVSHAVRAPRERPSGALLRRRGTQARAILPGTAGGAGRFPRGRCSRSEVGAELEFSLDTEPGHRRRSDATGSGPVDRRPSARTDGRAPAPASAATELHHEARIRIIQGTRYLLSPPERAKRPAQMGNRALRVGGGRPVLQSWVVSLSPPIQGGKNDDGGLGRDPAPPR